MKILILAASPRKKGNTNALVSAFCEVLDKNTYDVVNLYDLQIEPCLACRHCQRDWEQPNCVRQDDLSKDLFSKILQADLIVLATPVYAWFCTAPAKALLDRCVYALNKYYGVPEDDAANEANASEHGDAGNEDAKAERRRGPSIWAGKRMALITTCGYPPEKGADLLEEGIRRYCKHSGLKYAGMLCERHMGYDVPFMDEDKAARAKAFARELLE